MSDCPIARRCARCAALALFAFVVLLVPACDTVTEPVDRLPDPVSASLAAAAAATSPITQVSASWLYACTLRENGVIGCWGSNYYRQAPASWSTPSGFYSLSTGSHHTCAINGNGVARCRGSNYSGEAPSSRAASTGRFVSVSAGSAFTCALRRDGAVECWGSNHVGQAPALKEAAAGSFVQLTAAKHRIYEGHACALRTDGRVECWGSNSYGQAPPVRKAATGRFVQVSAGLESTCGVRDDGAVQCWGRNPNGGAPSLRIAATGKYTEVAVGGQHHSCGLREDGVIECWGQIARVGTPAIITPAVGVYTQISSFHKGTCARRSDGVVRCFTEPTELEPHPKPEAPIGFTAGRSGALVRLTWQNAAWHDEWSDLFFLRVERRTWNTTWGAWETRDSLPSATVEWTDTDVTAGGRYSYRIYTCSYHDCSVPARSDGIVAGYAAAPAGFEVSPSGAGHVDMTWTAGDDAAATFDIERRNRTTGSVWGSWSTIATLPGTATSWSDEGMPSGRYQYRIRACTPIGCSAFVVSDPVSVPPAAPLLLTAIVAGSQVNLAWVDQSADETGFELQRRDWNAAGSVWGPWTGLAVSPANTTAYGDGTVAAAATYRYRLRACSAWGCSDWVPAPGTVTVPAG